MKEYPLITQIASCTLDIISACATLNVYFKVEILNIRLGAISQEIMSPQFFLQMIATYLWGKCV